jgi:adenylylsulfate kinase-like enzyme
LQAISSKPVVLGGENTSHALYENSGFSIKVRAENLRGGNKTSGLMLDTELVSNTSFKKNKNLTNRLFQRSNFVQGYNCPNRPYEHRDVNGLYKLANVIGIPYPYKPLKMSSLLIKHPATNYNIRYINP